MARTTKKQTDKKTLEMKSSLNSVPKSALKSFNENTGMGWSFGTNWDSSLAPQFDTFVNNYLFPKLDETLLINTSLGNKFNWLAEDMEFIAQVQEEYVIKDMIPVNMNLSKNASLMLERNYPSMMTKLYGKGELRKLKFTLNNNDVRLGFLTLKDAVSYAVGVYKKRISDINLEEERQIKSMMVDYSLNQLNDTQITNVTNSDELVEAIYNHVLYLQNNDHIFNEANKAANGSIGRYTTVSSLENLIILTSDNVKSKLLNTKIANTYNINGLDITNHIISFRDLGGTFRTTADVTLTQPMVEFLQGYGDYQSVVGDIIPKGSVFTFDISSVITDVEEIKPVNNDLYAFVIDINAIRYKRYTKDMLKTPFHNPEYDEWNYWLHYYSFKTISPFYNKCLITASSDKGLEFNSVGDIDITRYGAYTEQYLKEQFIKSLPTDKTLDDVTIKDFESISFGGQSLSNLIFILDDTEYPYINSDNGSTIFYMKDLFVNYGNPQIIIDLNGKPSFTGSVSATNLTDDERKTFLQLTFDSIYHDVEKVKIDTTSDINSFDTTIPVSDFDFEINYDYNDSGTEGVISNGHINVTLT